MKHRKAKGSNNEKGSKGQAAVMDALFFMLVCAGAASLLFSVTTSYNVNTGKQINAMYNYEFANDVLISLHYLKYTDSSGAEKWFWVEVNKALAKPTEGEQKAALDALFSDASSAPQAWVMLKKASPTQNIQLIFDSSSQSLFVSNPGNPPRDYFLQYKTIYSALVGTKDSNGHPWTVTLKLYY